MSNVKEMIKAINEEASTLIRENTRLTKLVQKLEAQAGKVAPKVAKEEKPAPTRAEKRAAAKAATTAPVKKVVKAVKAKAEPAPAKKVVKAVKAEAKPAKKAKAPKDSFML